MKNPMIDRIDSEIRSCADEIMKTKFHGQSLSRANETDKTNFLGAGYAGQKKKLIISSGDISDADGFYAISQYAKDTDADVLFIMNYPAYMNTDKDYGIQANGLGYRYDTETYLKEHKLIDSSGFKDNQQKLSYQKYLDNFDIYNPPQASKSQVMKRLLDSTAISILINVWGEQTNAQKGRIFFCCGGINEINGFSTAFLKNEAFVYATLHDSRPDMSDKMLYTFNNTSVCECGSDGSIQLSNFLKDREEIYIDFNGSMAWLNENWCRLFLKYQNKIKCAVVMGGVLADKPPETMPSINGLLNRLSCATMNQLYAPSKTSLFWYLMNALKRPIYIVSNNAVPTLADMNKVNTFLANAGIGTPTVITAASLFYNSKYTPAKKPFDYLAAKVLTDILNGIPVQTEDVNLHFDNTYGIALLHNSDNSALAVAAYAENVRSSPKYTNKDRGDNSPAYEAEIRILETIAKSLQKVQVKSVPSPLGNQ